MNEIKNISRRDFLKGTAASAMGVAAMSLLAGCSSTAEETGVKFDETCDIVILGAGGAGLSAAIEAADKGVKKIILCEKLPIIGGTTFASQGMIAGYDTKVQKAKNVSITYQAMYDNLMSNANYRLDPELTKVTVEKSGETIDWLIDRIGVPFNEDAIVGYGPLQMMHLVTGGGVAMNEPFQAALEAAGIDVRTSTTLLKVITDENGKAIGVQVEGDKTYTIGAKAVILTTGGYAYNPKLAATFDPEMKGTFGIGYPSCTGDGIIAANNIGATVSHTNHLMAVLKDYDIMKDHKGTSATANISTFISRPNNVLVDIHGKRFVDEKSGGYMTQELNRPIFQQMHKDNVGYVWAIGSVETLNAANVKRGLDMEFITADTYAELADKMGVDATNLEKTLTSYNEYATAGYDPEFKRTEFAPLTAPYAAVKVVPCEIITYGGIARNMKAEVIRADESAIEGLYCAGEISCNSAYMGFTLSNCFTWGRIAGASAAEYISK